MKRISACFILIIALFSCETEKTIDPALTFMRYFGIGEGDQEAVDMVVDSQGFIYLLGNHILAGNSDLYLVKVDENGESVWEATIENADRKLSARDIELGADGNLIVLANITEDGERDFLMVLVNASDGTEIMRHQDGYVGFEELAYSITEISDGYIVSGSTTNVSAPLIQSEGFWFRFRRDFTPYGNLWSQQYPFQDVPLGTSEVIVKTIEAKPGIFYMFGYSNRPKQSDLDYNFLVFVAGSGGLPIRGPFQPGASRTNERLSSVSIEKLSTGYLLTGVSEDPSAGISELYAVKIRGDLELIANDDDVVQQEKTITNFGLTTNSAIKVNGYPTSDSEYLILSSENRAGNDNIYFTRLSSRLIADPDLPGLTFGGIGNDFGSSVMEYGEAHILILGTMVLGDVNGQRKLVLMKLSKEGKFE